MALASVRSFPDIFCPEYAGRRSGGCLPSTEHFEHRLVAIPAAFHAIVATMGDSIKSATTESSPPGRAPEKPCLPPWSVRFRPGSARWSSASVRLRSPGRYRRTRRMVPFGRCRLRVLVGRSRTTVEGLGTVGTRSPTAASGLGFFEVAYW